MPAGYFLGPDARDEAAIGGQWDYTTRLFRQAVIQRQGPALTTGQRVAVRRDLVRWHASVVVLDHDSEPLKPSLDGLLGPGRRVDDVWLWEVGQRPVPGR